MGRIDEYLAHLKSEDWQRIRALAFDRANGCCAFCGALATATHHIKYPKQFRDDSVVNVLAICGGCHDKIHGVVKMNELESPSLRRELTPIGAEVNLLVDGPYVYASSDCWCKAMGVPASLVSWFRFKFEKHLVLKEKFEPRMYKGVPVYRWQCAAQSLSAWHDQHIKKPPAWNSPGVADQHRLEEGYQAMLAWLFDLGERAIAERYAEQRRDAGQTAPVVADGVSITATLNSLYRGQMLIAASVDELRTAVPAVSRQKDSFLTAKLRIRELGHDESTMPLAPQNRQTLSGLVGSRLTKNGAAQGPPQITRLDGCSVDVTVHTWRCCDIDAALEEILALAVRAP